MHRAPHISIPCKQLRLTPCQMYEVNNYVLAQPEETRHDAPAVPPSSGIQWRSTKQKNMQNNQNITKRRSTPDWILPIVSGPWPCWGGSFKTEGDTLGVRFFTAFCNHWHCTCAMVLSLFCNHWQFLLGFSAMTKRNQNQNKNPKNKKPKKQNKQNDKTQLSATTPPLGVCNLVFFLFLVFLVSCFLVRCWCFEGLRT